MTKGENRYLRVGMNERINLILVKVIKTTTQNYSCKDLIQPFSPLLTFSTFEVFFLAGAMTFRHLHVVAY